MNPSRDLGERGPNGSGGRWHRVEQGSWGVVVQAWPVGVEWRRAVGGPGGGGGSGGRWWVGLGFGKNKGQGNLRLSRCTEMKLDTLKPG